MPKIVLTIPKDMPEHSITFAQPLNQDFMMPTHLLSHQSSGFYGLHFSEGKEGGEIGVISLRFGG